MGPMLEATRELLEARLVAPLEVQLEARLVLVVVRSEPVAAQLGPVVALQELAVALRGPVEVQRALEGELAEGLVEVPLVSVGARLEVPAVAAAEIPRTEVLAEG